MFVLQRQNFVLETEMSTEICCSDFDICIWAASSNSNCFTCMEKGRKLKKAKLKLKHKEKMEDKKKKIKSRGNI